MIKKHLKGFTLIELLIVIAIIGILSAIAMPNFLAAQTRAKVSRARADIRSIITALEAYRTDENKYPFCIRELCGLPPLTMLTTPVSFITGVHLKDPFFGTTNNVLYEYYGYCSRDSNGTAIVGSGRNPIWYIMTSNGPDKLLEEYQIPLDNDDFETFINTIYDPTNGVISTGNIYRSGGQIGGYGERSGHLVYYQD